MTSEFEIFCDPLYYDMWCLRRKGEDDFNMTLHFASKDHAVHARALVLEWLRLGREDCAKDAEWCIENHLEQHIPERIRGM